MLLVFRTKAAVKAFPHCLVCPQTMKEESLGEGKGEDRKCWLKTNRVMRDQEPGSFKTIRKINTWRGGEAHTGKPQHRTLFRSISLTHIPPWSCLPCSLPKKTGLWDNTRELLPHCRYTKEIEHFWVALSNLIASVHCTQEPK